MVSGRWGRESAGRARIGALVAALAAASGCGEPAVDVVVAWVDSVPRDDGHRVVRLYDAGERDALVIQPDIPGSGLELLQLGLGGRGRGVVVSGVDTTVWVERSSGRQVQLQAAGVGFNPATPLASEFLVTNNDDAILRRLGTDDGPTWLLAPLADPRRSSPVILTPPGPTDQTWGLLHAADAPVLVWAELTGAPSRVNGVIQVLAYPSDYGQGPRVDQVEPLGQGTLISDPPPTATLNTLPGCEGQLCLSPSGRRLFAMAPGDACDLWQWSWVNAPATGSAPIPERIELECPSPRAPRIIAAVADDVVVFDDPLRLYVIDLSAASVSAIPKPTGILVSFTADRGRTLVVLSSQGEVLRIDSYGPRVVSGIQSPCLFRDGLAVSPSGTWVIESCNRASEGLFGGIDGQIRRISVLGSELYTGIPMRPIAIDDGGNALLYSISSSRSPDDSDPRGLFVLSGEGELTRVDELEPSAGRVSIVTARAGVRAGRFVASTHKSDEP